MYIGLSFQVWKAKITASSHKDELVAIKEVNMEDLEDKCLENLSVKINLTNRMRST